MSRLQQDVVAMCAHAPYAVDVRASDGKTSRGPVEHVPRTRADEHGGMIEEVEQILTIPAAHLPGIDAESTLTLTDAETTSRIVRVHRRRPAFGDGLMHELTVVDA